MACHAIDDTHGLEARSDMEGPLRQSSAPTPRACCGVTADEAYLRESILEPAAKVVTGYERGESGMPSYAGVLTIRRSSRSSCSSRASSRAAAKRPVRP